MKPSPCNWKNNAGSLGLGVLTTGGNNYETTRGKWHLKKLLGFFLVLLLAGCSTPNRHQEEQTLRPPTNADPVASQALLQGNRFFADHQWTAAKREYKAAIQAQPTLAEAHYNLAMTLEQQGHFPETLSHYKKAMDLAPSHPVIQNAPPYRQYGTVQSEAIEEPADGHAGHQH